jgi:hypothetical protein
MSRVAPFIVGDGATQVRGVGQRPAANVVSILCSGANFPEH